QRRTPLLCRPAPTPSARCRAGAPPYGTEGSRGAGPATGLERPRVPVPPGERRAPAGSTDFGLGTLEREEALLVTGETKMSASIDWTDATAAYLRMDHVARAVSPQRPARANQLFIRLSAVVDYRRFLKIVIDRHRDVVATYKAHHARLKKFEVDVPAQEQAAVVGVSEEEGIIREDLWERVGPTLRLDIESFYIFAKIL